jgi:hypothetical protein
VWAHSSASSSAVTVVTGHAEGGIKGRLQKPLVESPTQRLSRPAPCSPVVVRVVERQESDPVFPAAEALATIPLHHIVFDVNGSLPLYSRAPLAEQPIRQCLARHSAAYTQTCVLPGVVLTAESVRVPCPGPLLCLNLSIKTLRAEPSTGRRGPCSAVGTLTLRNPLLRQVTFVLGSLAQGHAPLWRQWGLARLDSGFLAWGSHTGRNMEPRGA